MKTEELFVGAMVIDTECLSPEQHVVTEKDFQRASHFVPMTIGENTIERYGFNRIDTEGKTHFFSNDLVIDRYGDEYSVPNTPIRFRYMHEFQRLLAVCGR